MAARLLVCEVGGALLGKGRHALFLVGKREGAVEAAPLEAQPLPLRQLVRGVDTLLGARQKKLTKSAPRYSSKGVITPSPRFCCVCVQLPSGGWGEAMVSISIYLKTSARAAAAGAVLGAVASSARRPKVAPRRADSTAASARGDGDDAYASQHTYTYEAEELSRDVDLVLRRVHERRQVRVGSGTLQPNSPTTQAPTVVQAGEWRRLV